jgi:SAM-dependent methyltransferase
MQISDFEYIFKRLVRKFLFNNYLTYAIKKVVPNFLFSNFNETNPELIYNRYLKFAEEAKISFENKVIAETGTGSTQSIGMLFSTSIAKKHISIEPFVKLNTTLNQKIEARLLNIGYKIDQNKTEHTNSFKTIELQSVDIVLSNSVLEHVLNLEEYVTDLKRIIKENGVMLHWVDYRDHYFKYPYHFLKFSAKTWNKWLNPGSLPRWRVTDHIKAFENEGFKVELIYSETLQEEFEKVKNEIHPDFRNIPENLLAISQAVLKIENE